jgi:ATP-dependent helicase/nuclease subunit A
VTALTLRPADDDARGAIATELGRTIFVEAGAGTGKTSQLVARIVNLVAVDQVDIGRIAAITFTEAAAAELRQRVRGALGSAVGDPARPAADRAACAAALVRLDDAAISTLHAFAQRLIVERPLEAGVPPALDVATDLEAARDFDERWEQFLERLLQRAELEEALGAGITLGLTLDKLREIAARFHDDYDRLEGVTFTPRPIEAIDPAAVLAPLEAVERLMPACNDPADLLLAHLRTKVRPLRERIVAAGGEDALAQLRALASVQRLVQTRGKAECWDEGAKAEVVAHLREADDARAAMLHQCRGAVLSQLLPHLAAFARAAAGERRRCGRLVFHDLLVLARDLLRDHPAVRREYATRYDRVLIDEFQDTDPLQIEIGVLLAASPDADVTGRRWDEIDVEPGRLFVVGDPKQSIYRFRRADIDLYLRVRERFGDGLELLQANFRSRPGVLRWVNEVLERLMAEAQEGTQAPYVPLAAGVPDDGEACVHLVGGPAPERVGQIREREAGELVRLIASVRGRWSVRGDDGGRRPARYDDVAVLLPTRASLPHLERALDDAAVPYRIESRSLVFASAEVRDLVNVLRAADDPDDAIGVVAALRTPALAVPDTELVAWREAGGSWDHRKPAPEDLPGDHPVAAGLGFLAELHRDRWWASVSDLVERIVRERRLLELALAHRRPRDHWRRVQFAIDQARAFTERGGRTVREFVAWADEQAAERARVDENVVPEADDEAVRILTMHGAKGLEFPVAVLAGLSAAPSNMPPRVLWPVAGGSPEVAVGSRGERFATEGFEDALGRETQMERAEEVRLLYVAATRARDHLVVSLFRPEKGSPGSYAARLAGALDDDLAGAVVVDDVPGPQPEAATLPLDRPTASRAERVAWEAERRELLARHATAPVVAATRLAAEARGEPDEAEERAVWQRGRAGTSVGRAVHAVLQSVDLATGAGVAEVAAAQAAAEGVSDRVEQVERLARAALGSGVVAEAVSGRYWRELFVAAPLGERTVEGFVDLLYETPAGELVVVDYKTDELGADDEVDAAVARYRLQGAAYAAAVESVVGRPVDRCVFLFLRKGEARAREVADLPGAVAEVRARLAASTGG